MSTFACPIVRIPFSARHPNADTLRITQILGENVIFKEGVFTEGDLAIYIPEDAIVPKTVPGTEWLGEHRRIRMVKLRGIPSMGVLLPVSTLVGQYSNIEALHVGSDVAQILGIVKWEETMPASFYGENEKDPGYMPKYDMESLRKYSEKIPYGEEVIVTEKIHGTNFRAVWRDEKLWVGSHSTIKKESDTIVYWRAAKKYGLTEKLQKLPGIALYGEVYGQVQDLKYDLPKGEIRLAIFDAYDTELCRWLNWNELVRCTDSLDLPRVPEVYRGPFSRPAVEPFLEAKSAIASHNREGLVVKPVIERWDEHTGRVIFKLVSNWFRLRKNPQEGH